VYRKFDGSLHWHMELVRLGEDEHGTWLGAPAGSTAQRGGEPPVRFDDAYVLLIPGGDQWWTMNCNASPAWTEIYVDITTATRWTGPDAVEIIDLDLDVIRRYDGSAEILDADEFAEHRVRYGYPPDVVATASRTAAELLDAVRRRTEPFGDTARRWLASLTDGVPGG
jgi:protein associated with RNAse G/E